MENEKKLNVWWFASGLVLGLTTLTLAMGAVPRQGLKAEDIVDSPSLSEIRVKKIRGEMSFDSEIHRLASLERRYDEALPSLSENSRLKAPMKRISQQKYRASKPAKKPVLN